MGNKRIGWIDIAKGILIVIVVFHHIPQMADKIFHVDNFRILKDCDFLYLYYFMPAFFIITGFCSNFNQSTCPFILKNLKSLIFPSVAFSIILYWSGLIVESNFVVSEYFSRIIPIVLWGGDFWFLPALFVSKLLLWLEEKLIKTDYLMIGVSFMLGGLGVCLKNMTSLNLWSYQQGLYMNVFMCIGYLLKKRELTTWPFFKSVSAIIGSFSLVLSLFLVLNGLKLPYIGKNVNVSIVEYPIGIVMATLGTILILWISMCISSSRFWELLGRHTLLIYICHISIMTICMSIMLPLIPETTAGIMLFALVLLLATIAISTLVSWTINRYTPFLTGNFSFPHFA